VIPVVIDASHIEVHNYDSVKKDFYAWLEQEIDAQIREDVPYHGHTVITPRAHISRFANNYAGYKGATTQESCKHYSALATIFTADLAVEEVVQWVQKTYGGAGWRIKVRPPTTPRNPQLDIVLSKREV